MTGQCLFAEIDSRKTAATFQFKAHHLQGKRNRTANPKRQKETVLQHLIQSLKKIL